MPIIYTKGSKKTSILAAGQAGGRQFNFGDDWTEVRVGMFISAIADTGPNDEVVAETLNVSTVADYFSFGIKNLGSTIPGEAGSLFVGIRNGISPSVAVAPTGGMGDNNGSWRATGWDGVTEINSAAPVNADRWGPVAASPGTDYAQFFAVRMVVNDLGLSTQNIDISLASTNPTGIGYTRTDLRTYLNNFSTYLQGLPMNLAWNTGAAARDIPDCYFVRAPLFLNRARIACIRAIRYAP